MKPLSERNRGFSMVEILVAGGLIIIVISLSFAVLRPMIDASKKAKCTSNLRQIGVAVSFFASENNGALPVGYSANYLNAGNNKGLNGDPRKQGFAAIFPYLSQASTQTDNPTSIAAIFYCPASAQPFQEFLTQWNNQSVISSSYNQYCGWGIKGGNSSVVVNSRDSINEQGTSQMLYADIATNTPSSPSNHRSGEGKTIGANVLMQNGSVIWHPASDLTFTISRLGITTLFPDPFKY